MNPRDLPQTWREKAQRLRSFGCTEAACTLEHCATELEASFKSHANGRLTIADAAKVSGYSEERLRRLVRDGLIPNAGRPNAPRIRRADVPLKPGHRTDGHAIRPELDSTRDIVTSNGGKPRHPDQYDPEEDARDIAKLMEAKS